MSLSLLYVVLLLMLAIGAMKWFTKKPDKRLNRPQAVWMAIFIFLLMATPPGVFLAEAVQGMFVQLGELGGNLAANWGIEI